MSKSKAATNAKSTLSIERAPDEEPSKALAHSALRPTVQAALTAHDLLKPDFECAGGLEIDALVRELGAQVQATNRGDLARTEAMLATQAHTLDLLFNRLTRQAVANIGHYPETVERYMKLALRAQAQCRSTAEALHEMKYPKPVAFVQQANIANGPQQVNNGQAQASRAGEFQKVPNEVLEHTDGNRLDIGTQGSAGSAHPQMETVAAFDRAANARR